MTSARQAAIVGLGYAVPAGIRTNDDPVFDRLRASPPPGIDLFAGYRERRVLDAGESLEELMTAAAHAALADAGSDGSDIDVLLGYGTVSEYLTPNTLAAVHRALRLPDGALIVPVNNEFTNFTSSLLIADALITAGRARRALVVCGSNWTRHVDYATPQAISAGDGAAAAVVAPTDDDSRFRIVDHAVAVRSHEYGGMYMAADANGAAAPGNPEAAARTAPYFHITADGRGGFVRFGEVVPAQVVNALLARTGVAASAVTLVSHQASSVLMRAWEKAIRPAQYLSTLETFANMTVGSIPVTLASEYAAIRCDHLVLLGIGTDMQAHALLLSRAPERASERAPERALHGH